MESKGLHVTCRIKGELDPCFFCRTAQTLTETVNRRGEDACTREYSVHVLEIIYLTMQVALT